MFEQEAAEWDTAKTEFNARIYIDNTTNEPQLRFGEAFKKTAKYTDAEYSQVVYAVKYIDSIYNHRTTKTNQKYPSVNL